MYRYRKQSAHNDYSWDSPPPSKELSQKATMFLQSHAEARAHKTLIWFRHEQEGYLLFCYEEEGKFDSTGRVCEALVLTPLSKPLGFEESKKILETSWNADSNFSVPKQSPTPTEATPQENLLHILLCENIYYTDDPSTFAFACQNPSDNCIVFMSTKEIPFHEEMFGVGFVRDNQSTNIKKADAFITEYKYPLKEITPSRFQSMLSFSLPVREFLIGILAGYWIPEEHLDMLSPIIYDWFWNFWNDNYTQNATSEMAKYAIQNKDVDDTQIQAFLSKIHASDADFLLPWLQEQENGFDLAQQYFPSRSDIQDQIFPPKLQELWRNLQQGILPKQYQEEKNRETALTQLTRFRDLNTLPAPILEELYVHSNLLSQAYKEALTAEGIDAQFLDRVFSNQSLQELPKNPPAFSLPNISVITDFIFANDPPGTVEWLRWWEKQHTINLHDPNISYQSDVWEWSIRILSEEQLLHRTIQWKDTLSKEQKSSAVQALTNCSSPLLAQVLGLPHNTRTLSFHEAQLWTNVLTSIDNSDIRVIIAQQGLTSKESRYFEVLSLTNEQIQFLEGNTPPQDCPNSWAPYLLPLLSKHLAQPEYWKNWNARDLKTHSSWLSTLEHLPVASFLQNNHIPEEDIIQFPHLLSKEQSTALLLVWAKKYEAPQRDQIVGILLSKVPKKIYTWLNGNLSTPFETPYPIDVPISAGLPFIPALDTNRSLSFLLYILSSSRTDEEKETLMQTIVPLLQDKNIDPLPAPPAGTIPDFCCAYIAQNLQWNHWEPTKGAS